MEKSKSSRRATLKLTHAIALFVSVASLTVACGPKAGTPPPVGPGPSPACPTNPEDDSFQGKAALAQAKQKLQKCLSSYGAPPLTAEQRELCRKQTNSQEFATITDETLRHQLIDCLKKHATSASSPTPSP